MGAYQNMRAEPLKGEAIMMYQKPDREGGLLAFLTQPQWRAAPGALPYGRASDTLLRMGAEEWPMKAWVPPCDIFETDKDLVMKFELPEVKKEDVEIKLEQNVLTLHGERKFEEKTDRENYHRVERHYGEFMRSFNVPLYVDA